MLPSDHMEGPDSAEPVAPDADRLLTTVECAEVLRLSGVGPRYVKAGPGIRSRVLYRVADIRAWTAAHSYTSTSDYADR
jgi:hypothetical protein